MKDRRDTDQDLRANFDREGGATGLAGSVCVALARTTAPLVTLQRAWSDIDPRMWRDGTRRGRADQAFRFGEPGVMDRATASFSQRTAAGRHRMIRPSRRSPSLELLAASRSGPGGQREPAPQGTGRLSCSAQSLGLLKGGLDVPCHSQPKRLTATGIPVLDVDAPCAVHALGGSESLPLIR